MVYSTHLWWIRQWFIIVLTPFTFFSCHMPKCIGAAEVIIIGIPFWATPGGMEIDLKVKPSGNLWVSCVHTYIYIYVYIYVYWHIYEQRISKLCLITWGYINMFQLHVTTRCCISMTIYIWYTYTNIYINIYICIYIWCIWYDIYIYDAYVLYECIYRFLHRRRPTPPQFDICSGLSIQNRRNI